MHLDGLGSLGLCALGELSIGRFILGCCETVFAGVKDLQVVTPNGSWMH